MKRTLAPGHQPWNWKPGLGEFRRWHGHALDGDPSSIHADQWHIAINIRTRGGDTGPRAGLTKVNQAAIGSATSCIEPWPYPIPQKTGPASPYKLWILGRGLSGCSAAVGNYIASYDQEQSPIFSRVAWYKYSTNAIALAKFDQQLLVGTDDALRRVNVLATPYGQEPTTIGGFAGDPHLHKFTGWIIKAIQAFGTVALVALSDGVSGGKVALWNGVTAYDGTQNTTADLTGISIPTILGLWREKMVLGFGSTANQIRLRTLGSTTPGSYVTVTPGAGTIQTVDMTQHRDGSLYIASGDATGNIWKYDGSTLAIIRNIAGADVSTVTSWNGFLYAGYTTGSAARIARWDGTTWVDIHKDLTAQSGLSNLRTIPRMRGFRGKLYAVSNRDVDGGRLVYSPDFDTGGTWTEQVLSLGANNGDVTDLVAA